MLQNIYDYEDGIAKVRWEVNPDGMYYHDEDGFGMTDDDEINLARYISKDRIISFDSLYIAHAADGMGRVAKTEHSHPLGMVVSTHFRCGKWVKRGLKNGALPFNID